MINLAEHAIDAFLGGNAAAFLDGVHLGLDLLDRSLFHRLLGWSLGDNRWLFFHIHGGDLGLKCLKRKKKDYINSVLINMTIFNIII